MTSPRPRRRPLSLLALTSLLTGALLASSCYGLIFEYEGDPTAPELVELPTADLFELASSYYNVPRDLLVAISWHQSSFAPGDGGHGESVPLHGWMGLRPDQVELAAGITGAPAASIEERREANILGGAVVLAALRDEVSPDAPDSSVDVQWWDVVTAWPAYGEEWLDHSFAFDVFRTLQVGLEADTIDGELLTLPGRRIANLEDVDYVSPPPGDDEARANTGYPGRDRFQAAHSSNQSARSGGASAIDRIVIHTTEGAYAGAISWFRNGGSNVSAHYVIRRSDGEITQMVSDDRKAWHACQNNNDTIGIEHEGTAYSSSQWTNALFDSSARLSAWLVQQYGVPIDRDHIVGHGEIQPSSCSGRDDPGVYFDWDDYLGLVAQYAGQAGPGDDDDDDDDSTSGALVRWLQPTDGDSVLNPVTMRVTHPGTDHVELWSGPALLAEHRQEDPVQIDHSFPSTGPRTLTIRGYAASGSLLAREDIVVNVVTVLPGDDDDSVGDDDDSVGDDDDSVGDDDDAGPTCDFDFCVDTLPYFHSGNTQTQGASHWPSYSCAPGINESGPEVVYEIDVPSSGTLHAEISDGSGVDVDVHILSDPDPDDCLARGHTEADAQVQAGLVYVVVDSWTNSSGTAFYGPYTLSVTHTPDAVVGDDDDDDDDSAGPCTGAGTCVESFPFEASGDTSASSLDVFDSYSCAPGTNESGPEEIYEVIVEEAGFLSAMVQDGSGVDIDVHLLSALDSSACLSRGHWEAWAHVEAGTYYVVADTWGGVGYAGDYDITIGHVPLSEGSCAMLSQPLDRINTSTDLPMPATGPVVKEAHLVTVADGYGTSGGGAWPGSQSEGLGTHFGNGTAGSGFVMLRQELWAPQESSQYGQSASYDKLPVEDEVWYVNMYWATRPPEGTRMIVQANGRAVVAAAGYETGPGNLSHIGGVTEEIHRYLGTGHLDAMTLGFAADNSLPLGPIDCD